MGQISFKVFDSLVAEAAELLHQQRCLFVGRAYLYVGAQEVSGCVAKTAIKEGSSDLSESNAWLVDGRHRQFCSHVKSLEEWE